MNSPAPPVSARHPYARLVSNHPLANIAFLLVLVAGMVSYFTMPRAQDPEINFNWVSIITALPGAAAEEVERELTGPLEDAIAKVKDVKYVSSSSREGVSSLLVRFEEIDERTFDKRIADLRREIQNQVSNELPADATDPEVIEITSSNGFPTAQIAVWSPEGGETLRRAGYSLRRDLERLDGVDQVLAVGLDEPQLWVDFDANKVISAGLSPVQLADAVAVWFQNSLGGRVQVSSREWLVRLEGKTHDPARLAEAAIITPAGRITLGEVADVSLGHDRTAQKVRYNGAPALVLSVTKQADANTLELVEELQAFVDARNPLLRGQGVQLSVIDDQTHMTRNAIGIMESNAFYGLLAVLAMCWLFLGTRMAILVSLGIPFSLAGAFLVVAASGSTLNLTVLLGIVIVLGMVVDDAVVITESIYYRLERGERPLDAVVNGVGEVAAPVFSAVLTTMAAFLPLMLLPGILGKFMFVVPFVVTVALAISLFEAYWILPSHVLSIRPRTRAGTSRAQATRIRVTRRIRLRYAQMLLGVMRRPWLALCALVLIMALAVAAVVAGVVKTQFFAFDPVRLFYINVDMPAGTPLDRTLAETERVAQIVEREVASGNLRSVVASAGIKFTETEPVYGDQYGQVTVSLLPRKGDMPEVEELVAQLREPVLALASEAQRSFLELKGGPPTQRPISVKLKSDDYTQLRAAADAMLKLLADIDGTKDLTDDDVAGRNELRLTLNREKLARAGVSPREVQRLVRLYGEGEVLGSTRSQGEKLELRVRAAPETLTDIRAVLQRPVRLPDGGTVALGDLVDADVRVSKGYIRHYQFVRAITVEADLDREIIDTVAANDRLKEGWAALQPRFPNVALDFSGELDDIQESLDSMAQLFTFGIGLIYLILATQFRSYWQPLLILTTVPLAFTGVVLGLLVSGNPLSLYTLYGVIALTGIAVNSAIVLIDAANERRANGMSVLHAAVYAARRRVVPILITSVTTIGGLLSLATGLGGKSLMWGPVAASIVWGLGFSTLLTLFAVPLLFRLVHRDPPPVA